MGQLRKTRYKIPLDNNLVAELDVFHGPLQGLVMVEVELPSEDTPFDPLPWFGEDVSTDPRYSNNNLAQLKSLSELAGFIGGQNVCKPDR